jgi:hypothetical protein
MAYFSTLNYQYSMFNQKTFHHTMHERRPGWEGGGGGRRVWRLRRYYRSNAMKNTIERVAILQHDTKRQKLCSRLPKSSFSHYFPPYKRTTISNIHWTATRISFPLLHDNSMKLFF